MPYIQIRDLPTIKRNLAVLASFIANNKSNAKLTINNKGEFREQNGVWGQITRNKEDSLMNEGNVNTIARMFHIAIQLVVSNPLSHDDFRRLIVKGLHGICWLGYKDYRNRERYDRFKSELDKIKIELAKLYDQRLLNWIGNTATDFKSGFKNEISSRLDPGEIERNNVPIHACPLKVWGGSDLFIAPDMNCDYEKLIDQSINMDNSGVFNRFKSVILDNGVSIESPSFRNIHKVVTIKVELVDHFTQDPPVSIFILYYRPNNQDSSHNPNFGIPWIDPVVYTKYNIISLGESGPVRSISSVRGGAINNILRSLSCLKTINGIQLYKPRTAELNKI